MKTKTGETQAQRDYCEGPGLPQAVGCGAGEAKNANVVRATLKELAEYGQPRLGVGEGGGEDEG